ncbi:hypothetical protein PVAG01_07634 [Phlyctema vagabunda]|uniref:Uncharacterized protein n=1 Tax=Phlyctema vagabunda TaxID=108571 RepID=A0ABR4PD02_9HELO
MTMTIMVRLIIRVYLPVIPPIFIGPRMKGFMKIHELNLIPLCRVDGDSFKARLANSSSGPGSFGPKTTSI